MICNKCNRIKLRAEEEIFVHIDISKGNDEFIGTAIENSHREHICRQK